MVTSILAKQELDPHLAAIATIISSLGTEPDDFKLARDLVSRLSRDERLAVSRELRRRGQLLQLEADAMQREPESLRWER